MKRKILDGIAFVVAMSRVRRRLNLISAELKSLPANYRHQLREWVDTEWQSSTAERATPIEAGLPPHVLARRLDVLFSRDRRLDSESTHVRLIAVARWLVTISQATIGSPQESLKALHRESIRLLREIRQSPAATDPNLWFHVEKKRA